MPTKLNVNNARDLLNAFNFGELFKEELGWNQPAARRSEQFAAAGAPFTRTPLAELSGIVVYEILADNGSIPDAAARGAISREVAKVSHEHVLVFVDAARTQSVWHWNKREGGKRQPREHFYFKGQPGDLFISKIASMVVDISELDEHGKLPLIDAAKKVKAALDVERVIKRFYKDYDDLRIAFTQHILGIPDEKNRRWYASVLLNRLMFIYFLQRKFFLDSGEPDYLEKKLDDSKERGTNRYYSDFLQALFFEAFAKPKSKRTAEAIALTGDIVYLNGGLFLPHQLEQDHPISVCDDAFVALFALFNKYSWNLNDIPGESDDDINPDVLGYIFEKYINQKEFGAYYTRPEITEYLCEQTIHRLILDRINEPAVPGLPQGRMYESVSEMLLRVDRVAARKLLKDILPDLSILDPAVGSGAFLVAALKTLVTVYSAVVGWLQFHDKSWLDDWLKTHNTSYERVQYAIKKAIITDNLYGVDIMEEATEIAKLRLFMTLVASAHAVDDLEPLPNIDFNILAGNSLIGLMGVEDAEFESKQATRDKTASLFAPTKTYREILEDRNRKVDLYRHASGYADDLTAMRDAVQTVEDDARPILNALLRQQFDDLGVKFEQATWVAAIGKVGKPKRRAVAQSDVEGLEPLHWGFEFDRVINEKGGFDAVITNPPWEILKPNAKEFFMDHSDLVSKNKMTTKEFEERQAELLQGAEIREAWLVYLSRFPYHSAYFRSAAQYANQISVVNGKKAGSDINLYKLFVEQCYNLLRHGGQCGMVVPSGLYTDLGTKQLRELLFGSAHITGLFCFENRRSIFENVDSRFKFIVLTFEKGGRTEAFPAAFMRHNVTELAEFPRCGGLTIPVDMVRRLSPDSLSIMEFKSEIDITIAERMQQFPLLGETLAGVWNLSLTREFDMTNDSKLFRTETAPGSLPLYEGKMVHHFTHQYAKPRYWVVEREGREALLGRSPDTGQQLDYQTARLGYRDIARNNTDTRTLICSVIPPAFHGNKLPTVRVFGDHGSRQISNREQLFLCGIWSSFVIDYILRQRVTTTINFFYLYQLPVPRLTTGDPTFESIVQRTALLVCTSPEFDQMARDAGLTGYRDSEGQPVSRARLRAELDGLIAHLYGLTEEEFAHVLSTFPLVDATVKEAAMAEFKKLAAAAQLAVADPLAGNTAKLIGAGESERVEFKRTLEYVDDADLAAKNIPLVRKPEIAKAVVHSSLKTICAFLNSDGGTLLIGVHDDGSAVGIQPDLQSVKNKNTDGFELKLRSLLTGRSSPKPIGQVAIAFPIIDGNTVCRMDVKPDGEIYHLDGEIYVRHGNSTVELQGVDRTQWVAKRVGK